MRGRLSLYTVAFMLLLASTAVLTTWAVDQPSSLARLWLSIWFSAATIAATVLGLLLTRRR